jgi:DNA-binding NtrC family response regulator
LFSSRSTELRVIVQLQGAIKLERNRPMKLLLVEPYGPLARGLQRGLEEEGFSVTLAEDLRHAVRLLKSLSYDVVLLDIPRQIEFALLQYWRRAGISTPVLFFFVPGSRADQFDNLGLGPAAHITKPFRFDDLLRQLRRLGALPSEVMLPSDSGEIAVLGFTPPVLAGASRL